MKKIGEFLQNEEYLSAADFSILRFKRQADDENEIFDELDVKTVRILKKHKISVGLAYFIVGALIPKY